MSVLTDILVLLALIDVLQNDSHTIWPVSWPARTQLIVFLRANSRTFLAIVAPSSADAAATRRLRHRRRYFKDALRLSGAMFVAREAKRLASICVSNSKSEIDKKEYLQDTNIYINYFIRLIKIGKSNNFPILSTSYTRIPKF